MQYKLKKKSGNIYWQIMRYSFSIYIIDEIITSNKNIKTTRGIKIRDSKERLLQEYPEKYIKRMIIIFNMMINILIEKFIKIIDKNSYDSNKQFLKVLFMRLVLSS